MVHARTGMIAEAHIVSTVRVQSPSVANNRDCRQIAGFLRCVNGACMAPANNCEFNADCIPGNSCVFGICLPTRQTNAFETARAIPAESVKIVVAYFPEDLATCLKAQ